LLGILILIRAFKPKQNYGHSSKVDITFFFLSSAVLKREPAKIGCFF
jgi:hypothetical protein